MSDLPEQWTLATLKDIGSINPKHPKDLDDSLEVSFVPMPHVREDSWVINLSLLKPLSQVRKGYTHFADEMFYSLKLLRVWRMEKGLLQIN